MIATLILLALQFFSLGISLGKHGREKEGKENFWNALIAIVINIVLYYYAGLFDNFFK